LELYLKRRGNLKTIEQGNSRERGIMSRQRKGKRDYLYRFSTGFSNNSGCGKKRGIAATGMKQPYFKITLHSQVRCKTKRPSGSRAFSISNQI
jgi:hypothetical protein